VIIGGAQCEARDAREDLVYFWAMLTWSYASGERAGCVQKLSRKGWICKTGEGEMAMVSGRRAKSSP
jgi:hypothetical protein